MRVTFHASRFSLQRRHPWVVVAPLAQGDFLKRWFADLPIERKLRVVILIPALAAFGIALLMLMATDVVHQRNDLRERAIAIGAAIGVGTIEAAKLGRLPLAISTLQTLRDEPLVLTAEVYLPTGQSVASYDKATGEARLTSTQLLDASAAEPDSAVPSFETASAYLSLHGRRFDISVAARRDGGVLGYTKLSLPLGALFRDWRSYAAIITAGAAIAVSISFWLAALLQKQISNPIVNLAQTMQRVSTEENYGLRVEGNSHDEIGSLIDGFNRWQSARSLSVRPIVSCNWPLTRQRVPRKLRSEPAARRASS